MRHSAIAATAIAAARTAAAHLSGRDASSFASQDNLVALYGYARERRFPDPETLARKLGETCGSRFPHASLAEAPDGLRAFFVAFRAVAQALDPLHEDDDGLEAPEVFSARRRNLLDEAVDNAGAADADDLVDMAKLGKSLMEAISDHVSLESDPLHGWSPADDPAEVVGDLVNMVNEAREEAGLIAEQKKDIDAKLAELEKEKPMSEPEKPADDVASRTKAGQQTMDDAIAESGGKLSEPAKPEAETKKKSK